MIPSCIIIATGSVKYCSVDKKVTKNGRHDQRKKTHYSFTIRKIFRFLGNLTPLYKEGFQTSRRSVYIWYIISISGRFLLMKQNLFYLISDETIFLFFIDFDRYNKNSFHSWWKSTTIFFLGSFDCLDSFGWHDCLHQQ